MHFIAPQNKKRAETQTHWSRLRRSPDPLVGW